MQRDSYTPDSPDMLLRMLTDTHKMVKRRKREVPLEGMLALATMQRKTYDLKSAIKHDGKVSLIAQLKRTDPDMDAPIENYEPNIMAKRLENAGAAAIAVATNQKYYLGGIADIIQLTQRIGVPIIRQDFIYDPYQIVEARAAGADAVILIASLLDPEKLRSLISLAQRNRMTAVVQVHNEEEITRAVAFEPRIIAISNRDLRDFSVDIDITLRLRDLVPSHIAVISMGGLRTAEDVARVHQAQVDGIVVGQALLSARDTAQAIQELFKLTDAPETLHNPESNNRFR